MNNDLISRETLALKVRRNLMPNIDADGTVSCEDAERYFLKLLESEPAVDAVEVVRCSKCKTFIQMVIFATSTNRQLNQQVIAVTVNQEREVQNDN